MSGCRDQASIMSATNDAPSGSGASGAPAGVAAELPVELAQDSVGGVTTLRMPPWAAFSTPNRPQHTRKANTLLVKLVRAQGLPAMKSGYVRHLFLLLRPSWATHDARCSVPFVSVTVLPGAGRECALVVCAADCVTCVPCVCGATAHASPRWSWVPQRTAQSPCQTATQRGTPRLRSQLLTCA